MLSPLCLDGAEVHFWISDPNSDRCYIHPGQGGCSALSERFHLGKSFFQSGKKQADPGAVPAPVQPWDSCSAVKGCGSLSAKCFLQGKRHPADLDPYRGKGKKYPRSAGSVGAEVEIAWQGHGCL